MLLMVLAGVWAMVFGGITVTASLSLEGRPARLYGATLLGMAVLLFLASPLVALVTPAALLANDAARITVNTLIAGVVIVGLVFPFRKLRSAR